MTCQMLGYFTEKSHNECDFRNLFLENVTSSEDVLNLPQISSHCMMPMVVGCVVVVEDTCGPSC